MEVGIPSSPFARWERARARAIKGSLAIENFGVPVATNRDDSEASSECAEADQRLHPILNAFKRQVHHRKR